MAMALCFDVIEALWVYVPGDGTERSPEREKFALPPIASRPANLIYIWVRFNAVTRHMYKDLFWRKGITIFMKYHIQFLQFLGFLFPSEHHKREASQWMVFGLLLQGKSSSQKPLEALEACQHRL